MGVHNNEFDFNAQAGINSISFIYSGDYCISDGQDFDKVTSSGGKITVTAGRHGSDKCADWYSASVDGSTAYMIHTLGGDHKPDKLNFAIKGTLEINGDGFEICLGQGHHDSHNNWHLASYQLTADSNGKNGTLDNKYRLSQDGTHSFKVSKA